MATRARKAAARGVSEGEARRANYARADRILEEARALHPELRRPLTWNGLLAVLRRERIQVVHAPLSRPAALISGLGTHVLLLNSDLPPRRHTYYAAHEYAHAKLHVGEGEEPCFFMDHDWGDDPREDEAEYFAACLLGGPRWF